MDSGWGCCFVFSNFLFDGLGGMLGPPQPFDVADFLESSADALLKWCKHHDFIAKECWLKMFIKSGILFLK